MSGLLLDTTVLIDLSRGKEQAADFVTSFEIRGTLSHDQAWVPDGAHGRS